MGRMDSLALAERIREVRADLYGENGLEDLAGALRVPTQSWLNYERGTAMPAVVMLKFVEVTATNPNWLLTGKGDRHTAPARKVDKPDWRSRIPHAPFQHD